MSESSDQRDSDSEFSNMFNDDHLSESPMPVISCSIRISPNSRESTGIDDSWSSASANAEGSFFQGSGGHSQHLRCSSPIWERPQKSPRLTTANSIRCFTETSRNWPGQRKVNEENATKWNKTLESCFPISRYCPLCTCLCDWKDA